MIAMLCMYEKALIGIWTCRRLSLTKFLNGSSDPHA